MPAAYASQTTLPPPVQGSLPAGGLRLCREGIEPSGSLRKVFDLHVFLLSRAYPDASWAHARRKFFDLAQINKARIAIEAVERIDVLFAIEREINGMIPKERVRVRNERSRSLVIELERWLREQRAQVSKNNDTGKAIDYSLKRWSALTRFLEDGRLCISNNAAERELRAIAVGRRNWTFAGSDEGGRRAAAIYTLIATAKLNEVDPDDVQNVSHN
jgi:transposase